ncbi:MAG: four helix bundle protein [Planctomycetes bacterium]|nr:four helix bundle protein [Planctomycetota bacterium]
MRDSDNSASNPLARLVKRHVDLDVYRRAFEAAMRIFDLTNKFPKEEAYSLTDQIRRASRAVCANVANAWRQRRSEAAFIAGLADSESAAAETQTWVQFAVQCEYMTQDIGEELYHEYDEILGLLIEMITNSGDWVLRK